jgi:hypothetical protein
MFRASLRPSSGVLSNCSRSLQFTCKCRGGCVSAVVGLLVPPTTAETHPPRHLHGNRKLRLQFERAPDDGRNYARNMLSSVYATKQ